MDDLQRYLSELIKITKKGEALKDPSSKIVTICGPLSKDIGNLNVKFMLDLQSELTKLNCLPFIPVVSCNTDFLEKKDNYRIMHLKKICMSDIVIFANFWKDDSYNGEGTNLEIRFSRLMGKTILYTYIPVNDEYVYEEFKDLSIDSIPLYKENKKDLHRDMGVLNGVSSISKGCNDTWA